MSPSLLSSKRNVGGCSPSRSSSSLDEKDSKVLEAMPREHNEDSIIIESFLSMIKSRYHISSEDLHVPKRPSKKTKVLVSKAPSSAVPTFPIVATPCKETPIPTVPEKEAAPRGEGSPSSSL
ncbi:hypothetical protein BHE74_00046301 [Ensete ventricosum]|nr:hypothetical protein BHE74_00046301 [Ensete ventricosum]